MQQYREPREYKRGPDTVIDAILHLMLSESFYNKGKNFKITDLYDHITICKWFNEKLTFNEFLIIFKENENLFEKKEDVYAPNDKGIAAAMKVIFY